MACASKPDFAPPAGSALQAAGSAVYIELWGTNGSDRRRQSTSRLATGSWIVEKIHPKSVK